MFGKLMEKAKTVTIKDAMITTVAVGGLVAGGIYLGKKFLEGDDIEAEAGLLKESAAEIIISPIKEVL